MNDTRWEDEHSDELPSAAEMRQNPGRKAVVAVGIGITESVKLQTTYQSAGFKVDTRSSSKPMSSLADLFRVDVLAWFEEPSEGYTSQLLERIQANIESLGCRMLREGGRVNINPNFATGPVQKIETHFQFPAELFMSPVLSAAEEIGLQVARDVISFYSWAEQNDADVQSFRIDCKPTRNSQTGETVFNVRGTAMVHARPGIMPTVSEMNALITKLASTPRIEHRGEPDGNVCP